MWLHPTPHTRLGVEPMSERAGRERSGRMSGFADAIVIVGSDLELKEMLRGIVQTALDVVDARYGAVGLLDEHRVFLGDVISVGASGRRPPTSVIGVPVVSRGETVGSMYLCDKVGDTAFSGADEEIVTSLAFLAGVAMDNELLHRLIDDHAVLEQRERVALEIHDSVIQRLFGVGLSLRSAVESSSEPDLSRRLAVAVDDLDETVSEIRSRVFGFGPR